MRSLEGEIFKQIIIIHCVKELIKQGLPWMSSSEDSALPIQGAQVQSLAWELRYHLQPKREKKKKLIKQSRSFGVAVKKECLE